MRWAEPPEALSERDRRRIAAALDDVLDVADGVLMHVVVGKRIVTHSISHRDPDALEVLERGRQALVGAPVDGATPQARALRSGEFWWSSLLTQAVWPYTVPSRGETSPRILELLRSTMVAPLRVGGESVGVLTVISSAPGTFGAPSIHPEMGQVAERAGRIAQALDEIGMERIRANASPGPLPDLALEMAACRTVDDAVETFMSRGLPIAGATGGGIGIVERNELRLLTVADGSDHARGQWAMSDIETESPLHDAARADRLVLVANPREMHQRYPEASRDLRATSARAWAAIPVIGDAGLAPGVLALSFPRSMDFDSRERLRLWSLGRIVTDGMVRALQHEAALRGPRRSPLPGEVIERYTDSGLLCRTYSRPLAGPGAQSFDWYDVLELDRDQTLVVVGDATSPHRPIPDEVTRFKTLIRGYALEGHAPERIATLASRALSRLAAPGTTAWIGIWRSAERTLLFANAGHPFPVVATAGGTADVLGRHAGEPLGAGDDPYHGERLAGDDSWQLVVYTDGLLGAPEGARRLVDVVAGMGSELEPARIEREITRESVPADDVTVLTASLAEAHR